MWRSHLLPHSCPCATTCGEEPRECSMKGLKWHLWWRSHGGNNIPGCTEERSPQGEFAYSAACTKLNFLDKKKGQRAKVTPEKFCCRGKAYKYRNSLLHFFINRPDIQVVLTPQIFMILYLLSSFCCSATWFYIYRWLWDHSLLSYSNIINKHISSSCINRDLTFHDRTTKMETSADIASYCFLSST